MIRFAIAILSLALAACNAVDPSRAELEEAKKATARQFAEQAKSREKMDMSLRKVIRPSKPIATERY